MDFAMLPPEINSGRMYAGPGSGPMLAAAAAWDELAAELHSAASSYQAVIAELIAGPWLGPSSAAMAAAVAPYVAWLHSTAAQAEQTAAHAREAAAAYQEALASTVPPQVVAANRGLLARLTAKNLFGQYTAAIAAIEAQYAEMWAQDAAAMYGYARSSASATTLTPFTPPRRNTDPAASATQAAAVEKVTGTSPGNAQHTISSVAQAFSAAPNALQRLATGAPAVAADPPATLSTLSNLIAIFLDAPAALAGIFIDAPLAPIGVVSLPYDIVGALTGLHTDEIVSAEAGVPPWPAAFTEPTPPTPSPLVTGLGSPVSAGLGQAHTVGTLSVPPTWTIATPAVRPVAVTLPMLPAASIPAAGAETFELGSGSTFGEMALAAMTGRAMAGALDADGGRHGNKTASKRMLARTSGAATTLDGAAAHEEGEASPSTPRTVVTGVAAELREFAKLRDEGILTDEEFTEQKNRLLGR
ncbi:MAG: PPE domain-containing protein [Mycobacterium sp.]|uniref:PPE family protein, SVP subgroup n=1 Tax=Mycobacterium sp. TaxID=1785 RepID=UPI00261D0503|nr:PPE domain-containing protein [Mycobacterium sp.]MDI3314972.1 PPE domain-containing protein [Mycobacterium sp.]